MRPAGGRGIMVSICLGALCAFALAYIYREQAADAQLQIDRFKDERAHFASMLQRHAPQAGDIIRTASIGYVQITNPADLIQRGLILRGVWEPNILERIQQYVKPGAIALDVGAYIGTHTLAMARAAGPSGRIHAFDPSAEAVTQLERNLLLNSIENVTVHQLALGAESTVGFIGELDKNNAGANVACTQADIASGNLHCKSIANVERGFEMVRLDDLDIRNISFVKIDVEGHELDVLTGGEKTFARDRPVVIIEIWTDQHRPEAAENKAKVFAVLERLGYEVEQLDSTNYLASPGGPS
jgi:FkbM family methyltransferase